jgi:autophagy-related protein 18
MFIGFNDTCSHVITAGDSGFQMYALSPNLRRVTNDTSLGPLSIAAVEESSKTLCAVLRNSGTNMANRTLILAEMPGGKIISEMFFEDPILRLRVNSMRLVVVMERRIHVLDWKSLAPAPQISTTSPPNKTGIAALSSCPPFGGPCWLAWPSTDQAGSRGDAVVMDLITGKVNMIEAHKSPLAALEFCYGGSRLATCSTKGTIIRVYANPTGGLLYQLRRGAKDALIDSLVFSSSGRYLAAVSNTTTLHVFLCDGSLSADNEVRSFAKISVKEDRKNVAGVLEGDDLVFVASKPLTGNEATLEQYSVAKGDCKRVGEFALR